MCIPKEEREKLRFELNDVNHVFQRLKERGTYLFDKQKISDVDIIKFVRDEFKLAIGEPTAEELKISIGSAIALDKRMEMPVRGRDLASGLPKEVLVKDGYVRAAIAKSLKNIVESVKEVIEITPPELTGDILKRGIYLCGGGSMLLGIDKLLNKELNVAATLVDDPLTCVVRGTGILLENLENYKDLFHSPFTPKDIKT